jgi:hypothetical protein
MSDDQVRRLIAAAVFETAGHAVVSLRTVEGGQRRLTRHLNDP